TSGQVQDGCQVIQQQSSASRFVPVRAISHNLGECCFGFSQLPHRRLLDDPTVQVRAPVANLSALTCRALGPQSASQERHDPSDVHSCRRNSAFSLVCQWSAVMVIVIGSAPWAIGSADRKHPQSAILFKASLLTGVVITPAYGPGTPFGEIKVSRRTGMFRRGTRTL